MFALVVAVALVIGLYIFYRRLPLSRSKAKDDNDGDDGNDIHNVDATVSNDEVARSDPYFTPLEVLRKMSPS